MKGIDFFLVENVKFCNIFFLKCLLLIFYANPYLRLTMISAAKIALGKSFKRGPANKSTHRSIKTETTEAMCVRPPALTCTMVLDIEAVFEIN